MKKSKYLATTLIVIAILFSSLGFSVQTAQAASWKNWNFKVIGVVEDTTVTIKTANFPDNMLYTVEIGCSSCGAAAANVGDLDSDAGGTFKKVYNIPAAFVGVNSLWIKVTQNNNGDNRTQNFSNSTKYGNGKHYYPYYGYYDIPTIHINSVVRNSTVTFTTNNYPAGKVFEVFMGPMGTRGVNGYYAGNFNSGSGGKMTVTMNIPAEMAGAHKISIRTESTTGGFYSYNWFYNNTTP